MSLAGHVSRSMLARYSHIRSQAKEAAIAAMESASERAVFAPESLQKFPQLEADAKSLLNW
jgi:hypothetical protein